MKILYINHYSGSPKYGMEYRPYYLSKEWVKSGNKVIIIAASFSHLRNKNPELFGQIKREVIGGVDYVWIKTPKYKGNGIKRIINIYSFVSKLIYNSKKYSREINPNIVIASSTYLLDIFPAYLISRFSKAKLIFEVHDLWPLTFMELGGMSKWHPFILFMQVAEDFAYKRADKVVSILPKALDHMVNRGLDIKKFVHIPNGIDIEEWLSHNDQLPDEHRAIIERLKKEGKFLLGYAGSFGIANSLDFLIESAIYLRDLPLAFILVGKGPEKDKLLRFVERNSLTNVIFLPAVSKYSIPNFLSEMDILYIGWKNSPLYRFGISPNKLFDYMMAAKPIIHAVEAANDPVAESGCGISVSPENPVAIAEAIKKLFFMSAVERKEMGMRGREYVKINHDYKILAKRFLDEINAIN